MVPLFLLFFGADLAAAATTFLAPPAPLLGEETFDVGLPADVTFLAPAAPLMGDLEVDFPATLDVGLRAPVFLAPALFAPLVEDFAPTAFFLPAVFDFAGGGEDR